MTETTQQKRTGRQEELSGALRARRHWVGSHVEPLSGRQQQTMNSDETSQEPTGQRTKGGDCPGLEPRGLSGRQGEREKKGASSRGQEAVRSCRTRISLLRVGAMMAVQSMQWGRNRLTGGAAASAVTVPLRNQGPARAAKALHMAFCHLPRPAPVWARRCLHQLPRQLPWRLE